MNTSQNNQSENRKIFERVILEDDIEVRKDFLQHFAHEISNLLHWLSIIFFFPQKIKSPKIPPKIFKRMSYELRKRFGRKC